MFSVETLLGEIIPAVIEKSELEYRKTSSLNVLLTILAIWIIMEGSKTFFKKSFTIAKLSIATLMEETKLTFVEKKEFEYR